MKKIISVLFFALGFASVAQATPNVYTSMPFLNQVAIIDLDEGGITTADVGTFPRGLQLNLDDTKVFVANAGDSDADPAVEGDVSVIDVATEAVTTITFSGTGNSFNYIQISPNGSSGYVTNSGDDSVRIFDVDTEEEIGNAILVGDDPQGMAINSTGTTLYVANRGDDTVSVVDTQTLTVTATIAVGDGPSIPVISPDDGLVYVSNINDATVSVIDATTNTVIDTFSTDEGPAGLLISDDGSTLYVLSHIGGTLKSYSTTDFTETGSVTVTDPFLAAFNPSDNKIYVAGTDVVPVRLSDLIANDATATPDAFTFGIDITESANPGAESATFSSGPNGHACSLSTNATSANGTWVLLIPFLAFLGVRFRRQG